MDGWSRRSVQGGAVLRGRRALAARLRSPSPRGAGTGARAVEYPVPLDAVPFPEEHHLHRQRAGRVPSSCPGTTGTTPTPLRNNVAVPGDRRTEPVPVPATGRCTSTARCTLVRLQQLSGLPGRPAGQRELGGSLTDEYTDEELSYCVQVINQIAALPICDGNARDDGRVLECDQLTGGRRPAGLPGRPQGRRGELRLRTTGSTTTSTTWAAR